MEKGLVFGLNIGDLLEIYDQDSQSWKMSGCLFTGDYAKSWEVLPKSGMMLNGKIYEQRTWVRRTKGNASGLLPTPRAVEIDDSKGKVDLNSNSILRPSGQRFGASLTTVVKNQAKWPTPTTQEIEHPEMELTDTGRRKTKDGKDSHSVGLADKVKWPTPTVMDATNQNQNKYAARIKSGAKFRNSGEPIQKTLSCVVAGDALTDEQIGTLLQQDMKKRTMLPKQSEFVDYLRSQTTMQILAEKTKIKETTVAHWFRYDNKGFSYPSIEDWKKIKPFLKIIKYDKEIMFEENIEWTAEKFPTPAASEGRQGYQNRDRGKKGSQKSLSTVCIDQDMKDYQSGGQLNPQFVEWLMGYPLDWADTEKECSLIHNGWEDEVGSRLATGVKKRVGKLKCLGNSIVPQIAKILFKRIRELI